MTRSVSMRYRVPKIDMNTPKGRFANAYRLYRTALNNRDAQEYLIEFIRVVFGERYLNACEDGYRYNDYDPEWFDTFQSDYHKRVKEWRMTPEELEAERKRIRSYIDNSHATFTITSRSIDLKPLYEYVKKSVEDGEAARKREREEIYRKAFGDDFATSDAFKGWWNVPPKDE